MRSEHIFATASQFLLEDNQVIMGCRGIMGTASPTSPAHSLFLGDGILPNVYGVHQNTRIGAAVGAGSACASVRRRKRMIWLLI